MQVTRFKLVETLTEITAAPELTHHCIRKRIKNEDTTTEISMAKLFCGRIARYVADEVMIHYLAKNARAVRPSGSWMLGL